MGFIDGAFSFTDVNFTECIDESAAILEITAQLAQSIIKDAKSHGWNIGRITTAVVAALPQIIQQVKDIEVTCKDIEGDVETMWNSLKVLLHPVHFVETLLKYIKNPLHWHAVTKDLSTLVLDLVKHDMHGAGEATGDLFKRIVKKA